MHACMGSVRLMHAMPLSKTLSQGKSNCCFLIFFPRLTVVNITWHSQMAVLSSPRKQRTTDFSKRRQDQEQKPVRAEWTPRAQKGREREGHHLAPVAKKNGEDLFLLSYPHYHGCRKVNQLPTFSVWRFYADNITHISPVFFRCEPNQESQGGVHRLLIVS